MIIARGIRKDKTEILVLGLSEENISRLREGQPMVLTRKTHGAGVPEGWEIVIFTGKTEEVMRLQLELTGLVTKDTPVFIDPRLKQP